MCIDETIFKEFSNTIPFIQVNVKKITLVQCSIVDIIEIKKWWSLYRRTDVELQWIRGECIVKYGMVMDKSIVDVIFRPWHFELLYPILNELYTSYESRVNCYKTIGYIESMYTGPQKVLDILKVCIQSHKKYWKSIHWK